MEKQTEKKQDSFASINKKSFISVVIILGIMIALCGILTLFIPRGEFLRTESGEIIAGSYVKGETKGIELWRVLTAPFRVFFVDGGLTILIICVFLLIMSGVFNLLDKTDGIKVLMQKMVQRFDNKKRIVVVVSILFFMLFGSLFGLFEELVTLLPFVVVFMLTLGFDTMTGLGVCLLAACFGFSSAITNPFSVGIASSFAGISPVSGVWLRIIFFILVYLVVCGFILMHIKKITKNPQSSLTYEIDLKKRENLNLSNEPLTEKENKIFKVYGIFFIVQIVVLILTAVIRPISGYAIPILCVSFLVGGIIAGMLVKDNKKEVFVFLGKGALSMLPAVLLIALASSVTLIMNESGILDTIMNTVINFLAGKNPFLCAVYIYLFILLLQVFIGSASAKIFLVMPILLPVCSVIGISPSLLILIYCIADGFSDVFLPTNPVLLIGLSMANVSYGKWIKWTWKIQLAVLILSALVVLFGVHIGF